MGSLSRVLEYDLAQEFSAFPGDNDIAKIVSTVRQYLDLGDTLRARISQVVKVRCAEATALPAFLKRHMNS
jgi:hypothetical protein